MLLIDATDSVVHWVNVGAAWSGHSGDINCGVACSRDQIFCRGLCVWESAVLLKDEELSRQLTSGTRICDLMYQLEEDILSKFCDNINNWLNMCETVTL